MEADEGELEWVISELRRIYCPGGDGRRGWTVRCMNTQETAVGTNRLGRSNSAGSGVERDSKETQPRRNSGEGGSTEEGT